MRRHTSSVNRMSHDFGVPALDLEALTRVLAARCPRVRRRHLTKRRAARGEYSFHGPLRRASACVQAPLTPTGRPCVSLGGWRVRLATRAARQDPWEHNYMMDQVVAWLCRNLLVMVVLLLAQAGAASAQSPRAAEPPWVADPAWILVHVTAADIDGAFFEVGPGDGPQPSLFRTEYIRFVAESADGGVDLFVRDAETDQPSRFRIAETLEALCEALNCARVAAPAGEPRPFPNPARPFPRPQP